YCSWTEYDMAGTCPRYFYRTAGQIQNGSSGVFAIGSRHDLEKPLYFTISRPSKSAPIFRKSWKKACRNRMSCLLLLVPIGLERLIQINHGYQTRTITSGLRSSAR